MGEPHPIDSADKLLDRTTTAEKTATRLAAELAAVAEVLEKRTKAAVRTTESHTSLLRAAATGVLEGVQEVENATKSVISEAEQLEKLFPVLTSLASEASVVRRELFALELDVAKLAAARQPPNALHGHRGPRAQVSPPNPPQHALWPGTSAVELLPMSSKATRNASGGADADRASS